MTTIRERTLPNTNAGRLWTLERMRDIMLDSARDPSVESFCRRIRTPVAFWTWWPTAWVHVPDETDQTLKWPDVMLAELRAHGRIAVACAGAALIYGTCGVVNRGTVTIVGIAQTEYRVLDHVYATWNGVPYDPVMGAAMGLRAGKSYDQWTEKRVVPVSVAPWQATGS